MVRRRLLETRLKPRFEIAPDDDLEVRLRAELREFERSLSERALAEALRLLDSPHFDQLTPEQIRDVSEYRPIEIAGERFFERAWSRSKEAGAMLGFARLLGADAVRADLRRLRAALRGEALEAQESAG
jgi:hypothetical protein